MKKKNIDFIKKKACVYLIWLTIKKIANLDKSLYLTFLFQSAATLKNCKLFNIIDIIIKF